jgi:hypothetical protein
MPKVAMRTSIIYQITIKEQLDEQWAEWFSPLVIHEEPNGNTTLRGPIRDQGELHGMLTKVQALNLTLVSIHQVEAGLKPE